GGAVPVRARVLAGKSHDGRNGAQLVISRRRFIGTVGAAAVAAPFAQARMPAAGAIRFGYAAITWGGRDLDAIADIAAAGYQGIQLRATVLREFPGRPAALRDELARRHLT